jgi:glutamine amidotransferase
MIALIDYGIGNLRSVEKALAVVGGEVSLTSDGGQITAAEKVVLPGVGHFGDGMSGLVERGLVDPIIESVNQEKPFLGICLGMQLLFSRSDEAPGMDGLSLLPGTVRMFEGNSIKIPQIGWNQINPIGGSSILEGIEAGSYAYFNHGYYCEPSKDENILATTEYGIEYASVTGHDNLYGVQFHPEKSQHIGLMILRNFVELN